MFKEMATIANLMKQAPRLAGEAGALKDRLANMRISAGHAGVQVVVTGDHKIVSVTIEEEFHSRGDRALLEASVTEACNAALGRAREAVAQEMGSLATGLGLPGLSDALAGFGLGR